MVLLFLESIGTTELMMILLVALVVFGPRRLPELGRKIGKGMAEFRRASDDFKRTWEREVDLDRVERDRQPGGAALAGETPAALPEAGGGGEPVVVESAESIARAPRGAASAAEFDMAAAEGGVVTAEAAAVAAEPAAEHSPRKADWL